MPSMPRMSEFRSKTYAQTHGFPRRSQTQGEEALPGSAGRTEGGSFGSRATTARKSVLVVERDPRAPEALARLLAEQGYRVMNTADEQEALRYLQSAPEPGLVVVDLDGPALDGVELCQRCRRASFHRQVPIVVLSRGKRLAAAQALSLGVIAHLNKPLRVEALLETVERLCA